MAVLTLGSLLLLAASPSPAQPLSAEPSSPRGGIDVIEVSGRIDPIEIDFITKSLHLAETKGDDVLVVQLDSPGALVSRARLDTLAARLRSSEVPVATWVGPSGTRAFGGAARLLEASDVRGMAPGTSVGKSSGESPTSPLSTSRALGPSAAQTRGAVNVVAPTLGEFVVGLDGQQIKGRTLHTAKVVTEGGQPRRQASTDVRFAKLGLVERVLHASAGPQFAYILLVLGLLLMVFEFFTVGVGLAGAAGAGALILGSYGLSVLPTSTVALVLVGVAVFGFAIDVQAGAPRTWTAIGTVCLLVGSWMLFPRGLRLSWLPILIVGGGSVLFMVAGMASMVRARFSTPTIGRESMIGRMGEATTAISPEGTVRMGGGLWRARTLRATAIAKGDSVRVVAIDGLMLEVEPEDPLPRAKWDH